VTNFSMTAPLQIRQRDVLSPHHPPMAHRHRAPLFQHRRLDLGTEMIILGAELARRFPRDGAPLTIRGWIPWTPITTRPRRPSAGPLRTFGGRYGRHGDDHLGRLERRFFPMTARQSLITRAHDTWTAIKCRRSPAISPRGTRPYGTGSK